jgi:hypothetical protein
MTLAESLSLGSNSKCESEEVQLKKQALWYIYGTHVVSKLTFTDEYFHGMMHAQNTEAMIISPSSIAAYEIQRRLAVAAGQIKHKIQIARAPHSLGTRHPLEHPGPGCHRALWTRARARAPPRGLEPPGARSTLEKTRLRGGEATWRRADFFPLPNPQASGKATDRDRRNR